MPDLEKETQEDNDFIESLLNPNGDEDESNLTEEEKKAKELERNRNAEEARKRREKEAKEKEESEKKAKEEADKKAQEEADKKAKEEADKKAKEEADKKAKEEEESKTKVNDEQIAALGKQLSEFKLKYPDVDLKILQKDEDFRDYADGKLLGKKDFTQIYEGFIALKKRNNQDEKVDVEKNYMKQGSSTGSSQGSGYTPSDVYSEQELEKITQKLPFMHPNDAAKVMEKLERSIKHYDKK